METGVGRGSVGEAGVLFHVFVPSKRPRGAAARILPGSRVCRGFLLLIESSGNFLVGLLVLWAWPSSPASLLLHPLHVP